MIMKLRTKRLLHRTGQGIRSRGERYWLVLLPLVLVRWLVVGCCGGVLLWGRMVLCGFLIRLCIVMLCLWVFLRLVSRCISLWVILRGRGCRCWMIIRCMLRCRLRRFVTGKNATIKHPVSSLRGCRASGGLSLNWGSVPRWLRAGRLLGG